MLQLNNIALLQFKNYTQQQFVFTQKVVGICGRNGSGKTNLLDAIYYLCFTKSYFLASDAQNVQIGKAGMRIEGNMLLNNTTQNLICILRENNKKEFLYNKEQLKKFSEHIGRFPCVIISPDDTTLVTGSSELRRKYIDTIIAQINSHYLYNLVDYNKILVQRNSLLKQAAEVGTINKDVVEILNQQLATKANYIFEERKLFFKQYIPFVYDYYSKIASTTDNITLHHQSALYTETIENLLEQNLQKDIALQRTTAGIHRDDIEINMNGALFKTIASQGQRKSLLFALKLAEWQIIKQKKLYSPILLLDDVFEKLDGERMHNLLQWVCNEESTQVFITDTHKERLEQALQNAAINFQLIELQ